MSSRQGDASPNKDLAAQVATLGYWYHKINLPGGTVTPGWAPIDPAAYRVPQDLTGKRVRDVGAWDGYWTFKALKRGSAASTMSFSFFGLLYHLRHPLLALDRLAALCDEAIFVESAILDDYSPYRGGVGHGYAGGQMVMEFYPDSQYRNNTTNYWVPTLHCLSQMVRSAGFAHVDGGKLIEKPDSVPHCRGIIVGQREPKL